MKQMRRGVFETNSSSTHSITMCSQAMFEKWRTGKVLFDRWKETFVDAIVMTEADKQAAKVTYQETYEERPFYKKWDELSEAEVASWYQKYFKEHQQHDDDLVTYDEYFDSYGLECYTSYYTTESGDQVVAFGKYGYN